MAMKIVSANPIMTEPALGDYARAKTQATLMENERPVLSGPSRESMGQVRDEKQQTTDMVQKLDAEETKEALNDLNEQLKRMNRTIRFSIDEELQDVVVKVVDKSSGEIVSQIPPEGVLRLRERIRDMAGLLIEKKV